MMTYKILQIFVLAYTGLVVLLVMFTLYFKLRYAYSPGKADYKMAETLDNLRGKVTILLPLKILTVLFVISWLALALPWCDAFLFLHWITTNQNGELTTWFGVFKDSDDGSKYYFLTVFISILGAKGYFLVYHFANVLSDTSLEIGKYGNLKYRKRI